jgi:hypothetical protein
MTDQVRPETAAASGGATTGDPSAQPAGTAAGDYIAGKIRQLGDAVTRGVEEAADELDERTSNATKGVKLLAAAGVTGAVAAGGAVSLPIILLRRMMPGWAVALLLAGGGGAATALLARRGLDELGAAAPLDVNRIKDAARQAMRPGGLSG